MSSPVVVVVVVVLSIGRVGTPCFGVRDATPLARSERGAFCPLWHLLVVSDTRGDGGRST